MSSQPAPAPSSSAASPAVTDAGSHRKCIRCKKRMSTLTYDKHTFCLTCRDVKCDNDHRCKECLDWGAEQMVNYLKHRHSLEGKSKKRSDSSSSSNSSSLTPATTSSATARTDSVDSVSVKDAENRISANVSSMSSAIMSHISNLKSECVTNLPLSAPLSVPDYAPFQLGGAGGDGDRSGLERSCQSGPSGAGQTGKDLPPHLIFPCV